MASVPRPLVQFTLTDVLFYTLGVSFGLAYWRWSQTEWPMALKATFLTWLVVGLMQRLWRDARAWQKGEHCNENLLRIGISAGALILLAGFVAMEVSHRPHVLPGTRRESSGSLYETGNSAFYLALMAAFWIPSIPQVSRWPKKLAHSVLDFVLMGLAAYWAAKVLVNIVEIMSLVHIAIRNVENAQPTRWLGQPLYPANLQPPSLHAQIERLLLAFSALAVASAAGALLVQRWQPGVKALALLGTVFVVGIGFASQVLWSLWHDGLTALSPYFAEAIHQIASTVWPGVVLIVAPLAAAIALKSSVTMGDLTRSGSVRPTALFERLPAILVVVLALLGDIVTSAWSFVSTYWIQPPVSSIRRGQPQPGT
jgi:hypothetical protein